MSKTKKVEHCNAPGCTAEVYASGVCREHHAKNYRLACQEDGCDKEAWAKGLCQAHYMRNRRGKKSKKAVREYGSEKVVVFTRVPPDVAEIIIKASGRPKGLYEKSAEILERWARKNFQAVG